MKFHLRPKKETNENGHSFSSRERINPADLSLRGPFVPCTVRSLELSSRYPGPFLPRTIRSFVSRAVPASYSLHSPSSGKIFRCLHVWCEMTSWPFANGCLWTFVLINYWKNANYRLFWRAL